jgi:hypothetical protein
MGLSFTIADGPRQHCHSQVRIPLDPRPHISVPDSRLPQSGGPGSRIYIPQVTPPVAGLPFRRLVRLAGLRWRYSIPLPHGISPDFVAPVFFKITPEHGQCRNILFSIVPLLLRVNLLLWERVYRAVAQKWPRYNSPSRSHCVATALHAEI